MLQLQRILQYVLAFSLLIQAVKDHSYISGVLALVFFWMAYKNISCCAAGNCSVDNKTNTVDLQKEISFETINNKQP
jgi:hypothetical protein